MLRQIGLDLLNDAGVMSTVLIEPKYRRGIGDACPLNGQAHPIAHRDVTHPAHAPHVTGFDLLVRQHLVTTAHLNAAVMGDDERGGVGAVFLRLLSHQTDVRDITHGGRVEGAMLAAVVHNRGVHGGVAAIGDAG